MTPYHANAINCGGHDVDNAQMLLGREEQQCTENTYLRYLFQIVGAYRQKPFKKVKLLI